MLELYPLCNHLTHSIVFLCVGVLPPQPAEQCHVLVFPPEELSYWPNQPQPLPTLQTAEVSGVRHEPGRWVSLTHTHTHTRATILTQRITHDSIIQQLFPIHTDINLYSSPSLVSVQRWSLAVCLRSSATACTLRSRSTRRTRSVWTRVCHCPGKTLLGEKARGTGTGSSVAPTAAGAPAPPWVTWMTSQRSPNCLTSPWPHRRPTSTAAWSCKKTTAEALGTPPILHHHHHPRPFRPIRILPSKIYWMSLTPMGSNTSTRCCRHTRAPGTHTRHTARDTAWWLHSYGYR